MTQTQLISFFVAMVAITNPIGNTAIFIGMTSEKTQQEKKWIAFQCFIAVVVILLLVAWFGQSLLAVFGINIAAMQCAGGLIVILIGLSMMKGQSSSDIPHNKLDAKVVQAKPNIAVVPLAIPIVAGPGTMAALLAHTQGKHDLHNLLLASLVCIVCALIVGVCFYCSSFIARVLGHIGIQVASKVMGLILIAIAFQLLSAGLLTYFPGLA